MGSLARSGYSEAYDVALRWRKLHPGCLLPLGDGRTYQLLFAGRAGGGAGPDIRDAVLQDVTLHKDELARSRLTGDVEFHLRTSDWIRHCHHLDPRYNQVILHVVLVCDDPAPTRLQNGNCIPVCSLNDLASSFETTRPALEASWPCQHVMTELDEEERQRLFKYAGLLRFEQKAHAFVEQLRLTEPCALYDAYDVCLIPALAEGLGYGRDRTFFQSLGRYLLDHTHPLPEPLSQHPAPLDTVRLRALSRLIAEQCTSGVWTTLRHLLLAVESDCLSQLRTLFCMTGLSLARADILIINVVFPFALAVALLEGNAGLAEHVYELYSAHPGLPSNCVTRTMCAQLGLAAHPAGSCQQQGLHYIYQQACRVKNCEYCIVGRRGQQPL